MSNETPNQNQIQINDAIPGGEYANAAWINHNEEEFQMIFANILGQSGKVTNKVVTTPGHFKRMIAAMTENLKKYEDKFGTVKAAEQVGTEKEIGFKAKA